MAIKQDDSEQGGAGAGPYPIRCVKCGADMRAEGWTAGPVEHCEGSWNAVGCRDHTPHHARRRIHCKNCRRVLGCERCLPEDPHSFGCIPCDVWGDGTPIRSNEQAARARALVDEFLNRKGGKDGDISSRAD